ncbi:MAG: exodeoxyribonuclease VII large subunit [Endomicrobia bacterium]|nr:exodeoxyribonuclease VII large subunit [Endomicrobiia bacterium]MCL2506994.1 exodeoxyribonuclease VII large subunit [Endomicrobiia bacterium]
MSKELEFDFSGGEKDDGRLIYTVSQISNEIKLVLEGSYPSVWLRGEISNYKLYGSGHAYFSLKDEDAQIRAVMFNAADNLTFEPEDGMEVLVSGRVSSYPKRGDYQIIINSIENFGHGDLAAAFEKLKKKLEDEGLFDDFVKKEIPELVNKIGIVTSRDGAALHDILKVLDNLNANVEALIYPVRVQGKEAEKEIPQALRYLNKNYKDLDVLLVGRGGGSIEDLWAFNTEPVARAIFDSEIPVISCVGHETDYTIADFVADMRAPTPSAAAEMAVRAKSELKKRLKDMSAALFDGMNFIFEDNKKKLEILSSSRALQKPHLIYEDKISHIEEIGERLRLLIKNTVNLKSSAMANLSHKLDLVSPLSVLKRGFAVVKNQAGKIVKDSKTLKAGDKVNVRLAEGNFEAGVEVINNG